MSGTRNHFIPQLLQTAFACRRQAEETYVWAFRKGTKMYCANVINLGVEGYFYIKDGDASLDDEITHGESEFAALVRELRTSPVGLIHAEGVPRLLAHLEVRTRHLRESFSEATVELSRRLHARFEDAEWARSFVLTQLRKNPSLIAQALADEPQFAKLPTYRKKAFLRIARKADISALLSYVDWQDLARSQASRYESEIPAAAKTGQIAALRKALSPEHRIAGYAQFSFEVAAVPSNDLVLGDSIIFFEVRNESRRFRPFTDKGSVVNAVFLPLSPHQILIGRPLDSVVAGFDYGEAAARCSLEFFIAHENADRQKALQNYIGTSACIFSDEEYEAIIDDIVRNA